MSEVELWRDVPEYDGKYQASSIGNIRSVIKGKIRMMRQSIASHGYFQISLNRKSKLTHRIIYSTFNGPLIKGMTIDHIDMNAYNNRPDNLQQISLSENVSLACSKGKANGTYINGPSKIGLEELAEIRRMLKTNMSQSKIGKIVGLSQPAISAINTGLAWSYIQTNGLVPKEV